MNERGSERGDLRGQRMEEGERGGRREREEEGGRGRKGRQ